MLERRSGLMSAVAWAAVVVRLLSAAAVARASRVGIVLAAGAVPDTDGEGVVVEVARTARRRCRKAHRCLGERTAVACRRWRLVVVWAVVLAKGLGQTQAHQKLERV